MKPLARKQGLILRELPAELLVYDTTRHAAHILNAPAALVFRHSDGKTGVAELAKRLRREVEAGADETWVWLALDRLGDANLLERAPDSVKASPRREVLKRFGRAAVLPVVVSLLTPTPAAAVGTCNPTCSGSPLDCTPCEFTPGNCNSGVCCTNPPGCVMIGTCTSGGC